MKITVLGTGIVGQTLAAKLDSLGHDVRIGTRDPAATLAREEKGQYGNPSFREWAAAHPRVKVATFADAAAHGEVVVNALSGAGTLAALDAAGAANLAAKVLIDISNPLDFSKGFPPSLTVCNTDSLGETIQRAFPSLKVVKTLNTVNATVMVRPKDLAAGAHTLFLAGDDAGAKEQVVALLRSFGWEDLVDLGDITNARATEMLLPLWVRAFGALKTPMFSFKLVR
jgi:hypothetical protein